MAKFTNGIIGRVFQNMKPKQAERDASGTWWYYHTVLGNLLENCDRFSSRDAFRLALGIAEIFMPIDAIADRVSGLPYVKKSSSGETVEFTPDEERLMTRPNVFTTGSQLIYSLVFSELADGNSYLYTKMPDSYKNITTERITSLWCLRPDRVEISINNHAPALFSATRISDLVSHYCHTETGDKLHPDFVIHTRNQSMRMDECTFRAQSPLMAVQKNIDNLLAVYNARYNVYKNNGMAGIIAKKQPNISGSVVDAVDPTTRKDISDQLMDKYNISGHGNIKAITAVPIEFIKTIATISELEPFRETFADFVQIAGVYGVNKELLPRESDTTYANKAAAETDLWQNVVKGIAKDMGGLLTRAMGMKDGTVEPVFDGVECLQEDRKTNLETDGIELENLKKMQELGEDITGLVKEMKKKYEKSGTV